MRSTKKRRFVVPKGFARGFVEPARGRVPSSRRLLVAAIVALTLHGGVVALAMLVPPTPVTPPPKVLPTVIATRPAPPPPPAPEPPPPAKRVPHAAPPAAAQTAKVITRAADASAPLDLTDATIVTGTSETFAGGYSAAKGVSAKAVSVKGAVPTGTGKVAVSQARPADPLRHDWSCAWPSDAQDTDLRDARVSISVVVDENGQPDSVNILSSPAPSFTEAARDCALAERYQPALAADGHRIRANTPHFTVHFFR